jgi:hypothetical protein
MQSDLAFARLSDLYVELDPQLWMCPAFLLGTGSVVLNVSWRGSGAWKDYAFWRQTSFWTASAF